MRRRYGEAITVTIIGGAVIWFMTNTADVNLKLWESYGIWRTMGTLGFVWLFGLAAGFILGNPEKK